MTSERNYQYNFLASIPGLRDHARRQKKAKTLMAVLENYFDSPISKMNALDIGASCGIIDAHLADHFASVTGIDIDVDAIQYAQKTFSKNNLNFKIGDAMNLEAADNTIDVVICSQIYEHVPNAKKMMDEIFRVLRPGGICYFSAANRLMWNEPHYNIRLLSVLPRPLAHRYIRFRGKADYYHELHFSYWGLKQLVNSFEIIDYTDEVIKHPEKYHASYMLPQGSRKSKIAKFVALYFYWLLPGYIWLLKKPSKSIKNRTHKTHLPRSSRP